MFNHIKTDPELCIGCKTCMAACVASHTGKALFALKPDSFDFTPRVHVVYTSKITKAVQCQQCPNTETGQPACIPACPTEALSLFKPKTPVKAASQKAVGQSMASHH